MRHIILFSVLALLLSCSHKEKKSYEQYAASGLTTRTEALRQNLPRLADGGTLIGQEYATLSGIGWRGDSARSDIKTVCGDYPAVSAYRLDGIETGRNADGFTAAQLRADILETVRRGSLVVCTCATAVPTDFMSSLEDGYGKLAPVLLILSTPQKCGAAREAIERADLHNVLLAYAAHTAEALAQAPDGIAAVILTDAKGADIPAAATLARQRGVALGITLMPATPDDDYWVTTALPLVTTPGIAFVVIAANSGEPGDSNYHAPYPGGPGAEGFMQLYNHPHTRFAHDLNGLYLAK